MINKNIILIGMKACGKSTVGRLMAEKLKINFIELDEKIEKAYSDDKKMQLTCREIFKKHGEKYFRSLEKAALRKVFQELNDNKFALACGGGTALDANNQKLLQQFGKIIYLDIDAEVLLSRILEHGMPAFFDDKNNPEKSLTMLLKKRRPIYQKIANLTITFTNETPMQLVRKIICLLKL